MDPLTAASLAGTVIQFVDFGSKLVSASRELYANSQLDVHAQAAKAVSDLLDYSTKLQRPLQAATTSRALTEDEIDLGRICRECNELAQTLLKRLDRLKIPAGRIGRKKRKQLWPSLKVAVESLWTNEDLQAIEGRLHEYREEIDSRILRSLRQVHSYSCPSLVAFRCNIEN